MRFARSVAALLVLLSTLGACGEGGGSKPDFVIGASATWRDEPASVGALGYSLIAELVQKNHDGLCRDAPSSTKVFLNDSEMPLTRDSDSRCLAGKWSLPPTLHPGSLSVRLEDAGGVVAEALFEDLAPGAAATLGSPQDGRVRAGDEVVVVPPSALPTSDPGGESIFPLEGATWDPAGLQSPELPRRLFDGIHVKVPSFEGPAVLVLRGMPFSVEPLISSCEGFFACTGIASNTLGPVSLVGEP
jgi:hypothetical protein